MATTDPPLAVTVGRVLGHFAGVEDLLADVADLEQKTIDQVVAREIRNAMKQVEVWSEVPFFVTRYCTRELARQWGSEATGIPLTGQAPSQTGVMPLTTLTAAPQTVTFLHAPASPQPLVLFVTPGTAGAPVSGTVAINGIGANGGILAESIVPGARAAITTTNAYAAITSIVLPARSQQGDAVSLGISMTGLIMGSDFDEYCQPQDYKIDQAMNQTLRTVTPRAPLASVDYILLSLENNGVLFPFPMDWVNRDDEHGVIHLMPQALAATGLAYVNLMVWPYLRGVQSGITPLLIHLRYSAGLVSRTLSDGTTPYDPDADPPLNTAWPQEMVENYRSAVAKLAAVPLLPKVARALDRGGASVGIAGMSMQVNSAVLRQDAKEYFAETKAWAEELRQTSRDPGWVFA